MVERKERKPVFVDIMSSSIVCNEFPCFSQLPPELQSQIWRAAKPCPAIHIFDVCVPGSARSERAFKNHDGRITNAAQWQAHRNTIFLDILEIHNPSLRMQDQRLPSFPHDPSMYRFSASLRETCFNSRREADLTGRRDTSQPGAQDDASINTVYLPGRGGWINYDNNDVLCLRFGRGDLIAEPLDWTSEGDLHRGLNPGIAQVLGATWSAAMATTLRRARRVALDVSELWTPDYVLEVLVEEIAHLSSVLQENLEVLYLVDYCAGRCRLMRKNDTVSGDEAKIVVHNGKGKLGDVIHGTYNVYREDVDGRQLGWDDKHPARLLSDLLDNAIRSQQGRRGKFLGVRALICDEVLAKGGVNTPMTRLDCGCI
jgi:hypothetical protein